MTIFNSKILIKAMLNSKNHTKAILNGTVYPFLIFSPLDIDDCFLWLDGADESTITFDSTTKKVSAWADKSTAGRDATQSTSNNQPVYNSSGLNGKGSIDFPGDRDGSLGGVLDNAFSELFVVAVARLDVTSGSGAGSAFRLFTMTAGTSNDWQGTGHYIPMLRDDSTMTTFVNGARQAAATFTDDTATIFHNKYTVSQIENRAGSNTATYDFPSDHSMRTQDKYKIGDTGTNMRLVGTVAELIAYSSIPSESALTALSSYLEDKWGV